MATFQASATFSRISTGYTPEDIPVRRVSIEEREHCHGPAVLYRLYTWTVHVGDIDVQQGQPEIRVTFPSGSGTAAAALCRTGRRTTRVGTRAVPSTSPLTAAPPTAFSRPTDIAQRNQTVFTFRDLRRRHPPSRCRLTPGYLHVGLRIQRLKSLVLSTARSVASSSSAPWEIAAWDTTRHNDQSFSNVLRADHAKRNADSRLAMHCKIARSQRRDDILPFHTGGRRRTSRARHLPDN